MLANSSCLCTSSSGGRWTDPNISKGAGTFGVSGPDSNGARIHTVDDAYNIVNYYIERGYNMIDTARRYGGGTSEEVRNLTKNQPGHRLTPSSF